MNVNELVLDRVRSATFHDLTDNKMLLRITSIEDPSLNCTAEGEEVTDAVGALITTLYRAKRAEFSGTNSLFSMDLAAVQYGAEKEVASKTNKITDYTYEILKVAEGETNKTLAHIPTNDVKYIYSIVNNETGTAYTAGAAASATEFVIDKETGKITVPTGFVGSLFVEYQYEAEEAVRVQNMASNFPEAGSLIIYAYFKDKCNENIVYSGKIICPKAKINPESVELALTSTGKHAFNFIMMKDYCATEGEDLLFSIVISK